MMRGTGEPSARNLSERSSVARNVVSAAVALGSVAMASILGQVATFPNLSPWFAGLIKPSFNPPSWVFAPVWTTLYALMAFALWRVLRARESSLRTIAVSLFFIQLALNAAWPWMFFWAHSPLLGLINIVPQFLAILATLAAFARLDPLAAWCFVPLAVWVGYASILNFSLWRFNG
jgi:translocator protein